MQRKSILLVIGCSCLLAVLWSLIGYFVWQSRQSDLSAAEHALKDKATLLAAHTEGTLFGIERTLDAVAEMLTVDPTARRRQSERFNAFLNRMVAANPYLIDVGVSDAQGLYRYSAARRQRLDVSRRDFFSTLRAAPDLPLYIGITQRSLIDPDRWIIGVSRPLRDAEGAFDGVVVAILDVDRFLDFYRGLLADASASVSLSRADGLVMMRMPGQGRFVGTVNPHIADAAGQPQMERLLVGSRSLDGAVRIIADHRLSGYPLVSTATLTLDGALAGWRQDMRAYLGFGLTATLAALLTTAYLLRQLRVSARADEGLRQAATVFTSTQEGVVITDLQGDIVAVNPAFCEITEYEEASVIGRNMRILQSGRHDRAFYQQLWSCVVETGSWQGEVWSRRKSGELYPEWLTISTVRDEAGLAANYVGTFTDITRVKQSESRLEFLAHHDPLTGLPNRLLLMSRLGHAIERSRRTRTRGAILFCDLDRFKTVNDSLGHRAGDELLQLVAQAQRQRLREMDTLARLGGDEFVVLLEDLAGAEAAANVAQALIDQFSAPFVLAGGQEVYVGASIGISVFPDDGDIAEHVLQQADSALYEAKASGRGTYRFYTEALTAAANTRLEMETHLRRGLQREELTLHYQPQVSLIDGSIRGIEALARWQTPDGRMVSPDCFIPLAEETGLIIPLGDWVLRTACRQMKHWLDRRLPVESLSVNLSAVQFHHAGLVDRIATILAETGLPARHLELEITETTLMEHGREAKAKLAALKGLGLRLSVDDFGTGYSSLAYLKRFPIDQLKVDRSFVRDIPDDPADMEIAAAVIGIGRTLNLEVVAEGVETPAQVAFLKEQGCQTGQGFLFSPPRPASEIEHLLAEGLMVGA